MSWKSISLMYLKSFYLDTFLEKHKHHIEEVAGLIILRAENSKRNARRSPKKENPVAEGAELVHHYANATSRAKGARQQTSYFLRMRSRTHRLSTKQPTRREKMAPVCDEICRPAQRVAGEPTMHRLPQNNRTLHRQTPIYHLVSSFSSH